MTLLTLVILICFSQSSQGNDQLFIGTESLGANRQEIIKLRILEITEKGRIAAQKELVKYLQTTEGEIYAEVILKDKEIKALLQQGIDQVTLEKLSYDYDAQIITKEKLAEIVNECIATAPVKMSARVKYIVTNCTQSPL